MDKPEAKAIAIMRAELASETARVALDFINKSLEVLPLRAGETVMGRLEVVRAQTRLESVITDCERIREVLDDV